MLTLIMITIYQITDVTLIRSVGRGLKQIDFMTLEKLSKRLVVELNLRSCAISP